MPIQNGASSLGGAHEAQCTLLPAKGAKKIRFEAFSKSQMVAAERVFEFRRLPTKPTANLPEIKVDRPGWLIDDMPTR